MSTPFAYHDDLKKRLRRIEGQVRGVLRLMEEDANCKDVITQLSAVRSAADKAIAHIVAENLQHCLLADGNSSDGHELKVKQAIELLVKSR